MLRVSAGCDFTGDMIFDTIFRHDAADKTEHGVHAEIPLPR